jgi:hypothetical protein
MHCRRKLSDKQLDEYTRLLMHVIALSFRNNRWDRRLPQLRLDPQDVAQDCLRWIVPKSKGGLGLRSLEPLVLMQVLYTSLKRRVLDAINEAVRKSSREIAATDYFTVRGGVNDSESETQASPDLPRVSEIEKAIDSRSEDYVIGPIVTKTAAEADAAEKIFKCMKMVLVKEHALIPFDRLSPSIQEIPEVTLELHARIKARFYRFLGECSELAA